MARISRIALSSKHKKVLLAFVFFVLVFMLFSIPGFLVRDNLQLAGDDASYISHAFTLGIDFDLDYSNEIAKDSPYLNKDKTMLAHQIGTGIMAAPFVALFSVVDRLSGHPVIADRFEYRFSWSYFGFAFASSFWFLLGILFLVFTSRLINYKGNFLEIFLLSMSSGCIYFAVGRFTMSHAYEFFSLALLLWVSIKWSNISLKNYKQWVVWSVALSLCVVLSLSIRSNNINAIFLPLLIFFSMARKNKSGPVETVGAIILYVVVLAIAYVPLGLFNLTFFDSYFPKMSEMYEGVGSVKNDVGFVLGKIIGNIVHIPAVLFSSEFGLLFTNPLLVFGMLSGLFLVARNNRTILNNTLLVISGFLFYAIPFAIVLYWETTASSYGYRYLLSTFAGSYFLVLKAIAEIEHPRIEKILKCMLMVLCAFSLACALYFRSSPEFALSRQINIFGKNHRFSGRFYVANMVRYSWRPKFIFNTVAKGQVGFIAYPFLKETVLVENLPSRYRDKYLGIFYHIPFSVYLQVICLVALWGMFGSVMYIASIRTEEIS